MILSLDLATHTGYAVGNPCGVPVYGHFKIDAPTYPSKFLQMGRLVSGLIKTHDVDAVFLEQPFVGRAGQFSALMPLFGFRAAAMMAAESKGCLVTMVLPSTVRKHFIGHGGLSRAKAKPAVIEKCEWRGWRPKNDDEADALALWDYACALGSSEHFAMGMRRG